MRDTVPAEAAAAAKDLAYKESLSRENGFPEAETLARFAVDKADAADDVITLAMYQDTLGWVLHQEGNDKAALPYCQVAANGIPELADGTYHLAAIYEALGDTENATKAYTHLAALEPLNADAKTGLARMAVKKPSA